MSERTWPARITGLGILAAVIAALIILVAGPGHRFGVVPTRFAVFGSAGAGLIAAFAVVLLLIGMLSGGARSGRRARAGAALVVSGLIAFQIITWTMTARSVPAIHDISTDTANPPAFDALLGARANAPNPAAYAGPETAARQAEAYPDISPLRFEGVSVVRALDAAEAAARAIGLEAVIAQPGKQLVEGTDVTFWYGYKDDVVIRVRAEGGVTVVDIRSKSRVGQSDLGTNAKRIRALAVALRRELEG